MTNEQSDRNTRIHFLSVQLAEVKKALAEIDQRERGLMAREAALEKELRALRIGPEIQLELGLRN